MSARQPILIAGGGIGGLALALALARRDRPSIVLERQETVAPLGAGIQIGPNGMHALQALGLADALQPFAGVPEAIAVHAGSSGRVLTRLPLGQWIAGRHGAPYWVAHRGDLHRVLLDAANSDPRITLRSGFDIAAVAQTEAGVTVADRSGAMASGPALVGADGLWSAVRQFFPGMPAPEFAGATATRTTIPAARAGRLAIPAVGLWLNPHAHVVHYPVRGGSDIAVVVIARETWQGRQWDAEADAPTLLAQMESFHPSLTTILRTVTAWRKWALYTLPPLPSWTAGRAALLGDAAHPMLPYLAQGGALAMEDALVLAGCVAHDSDIPAAFGTYASLRRDRTRRVQAASVRQGRIYRLAPPLSQARDAVFRAAPAALIMSRLDWLYGWRPAR
ncbi:MAG: FAD-dependent monooxygenase [Hyphomonadaceae bacterium]|nr:FAD-dependent monooxygenase [Hyphomonadaceae bacterium]